jgi:hypothetical protein
MARKEKMEMHDLARETEPEDKGPEVASPAHEMYHYGMRINPGEHELKTVGIEDAVTPGEVYHLHGHARVVDSHEDPETGERHATMHFTHMAKAEKLPEGQGGKSVRDEISDSMAAQDLKAEGKAKEPETKNTRGEAL